jgi:O-acetyl-ADP-ribose deacetylase (regulator of RNase III)
MKSIKISLLAILMACADITFASEKSDARQKSGCAQFVTIFNEAKAKAQANDGLGETSGITYINHVCNNLLDKNDHDENSLFHSCRKSWLQSAENKSCRSNGYSLTATDEDGLQKDGLAELTVYVYDDSWPMIKKQLKKKFNEFINKDESSK